MTLTRPQKEQTVEDLTHALRGAPAVVVLSFRAFGMKEVTRIRRTLRPAGGRIRVVPKRLFRRVLEGLSWPVALSETDASIAVAWGTDLLAPAKAVHAFAKDAEGAQLLGGVLEGRILTGDEVAMLAQLPERPALYGQLVSVIAGPLRGLAGVCQAVLLGLPAVLRARVVSQES